MNIYILTRMFDDVSYDENDAMIVVAENPEEARRMANLSCADEGKIWGDVNKVFCCEVDNTLPGPVLTSFNAA